MNFKKHIICILLLMIILGCKKDEDFSAPSISITSPAKEQLISVADTFRVEGRVTDEYGVEFISVQLFDSEMHNPRKLASVQVENQKDYVFDLPCIINDTDLESGVYYINVTAYNKHTHTNAFVKVMVNEIPAQLSKILVLCSDKNAKTGLYELSEQNSPVFIEELPGSPFLSDISSNNRQLYTMQVNSHQELLAYGLDYVSQLWSIQPGLPYPLFTDLNYLNGRVYYSTQNGEITGLNQGGIVQVTTPVNADTFPEVFAVNKDHLIGGCKVRLGGYHIIRTYYRESGVFVHHFPVDFGFVDLYNLDDEYLLVFGKRTNGALMRYHPEFNELTTIRDFEFPLDFVEQLSPDKYLLVTHNGIYYYDVTTNHLESYMSFQNIRVLKFEPLNRLIYISEGNTLYLYDYQTTSLLEEIVFPSEVQQVQFLYNKDL